MRYGRGNVFAVDYSHLLARLQPAPSFSEFKVVVTESLKIL